MRMRWLAGPVVAALLLSVSTTAQTVIKNPRAVTFTCPDHGRDDGHEVDIINSAGVVIQTLQGGDPPADASGVVTVVLNVQPIAFGSYTIVVRAVAGTAKSTNSVPSDVWERAVMQTGKPGVQ